MDDLKPTAAVVCLPILFGQAQITALDPGRVTSVAPYPGHDVTAALAPLGLSFPAPGTVNSAGAARIVWAGRDLAFLMGAVPPSGLAEVAALTDQSDGWVWVTLSGADARTVLSRLTPLDLRDHAFADGHCARSTLSHMQAIFIRSAPQSYDIAVFRSMAGTLVHDLTEAMRAVAARTVL